jgi:uncharacterized membrane protein
LSKYIHHEYNSDEPVVTDLRLAVLGICLIACLLFGVTLFLDFQVQRHHYSFLAWITIGNVDDARVMLASIIQSVSTVLGLVFSVVLLVLSMAASQFGPRLLRRFILDHNGQGTVGLFMATFLFSLFTLIVVRFEDGQEFIPHITIYTAIILMIISFGSLITFSQSIRKGIQTGNLIARVTNDLSRSIARYIEQRKTRAQHSASFTENAEVIHQLCIDQGYAILASKAGYLQNINFDELIKAATAQDLVLELKVHPGNFIIKGTIIAYVIPADKGASLLTRVNKACTIGPNRTITQDPEFAFAQIVEIGTRALSSAINDTYTGIACIDWLCNNIFSLVELPETGDPWRDAKGHIRIIDVPVKFPRLVAAAFDMIRESGANNPAILIRILQNFTRMAPHFKSKNQIDSIMRQVKAIRETINLQSFTETDFNDIIDFYNKAYIALSLDLV